MQKNVPKYTPEWVETVPLWAEASQARRVATRCATTGARCCGSPTSGPSSTTRRWPVAEHLDRATHLVLDLDPPRGRRLRQAVAAAHLVRQALDDVGLAGAVKTSGAKGVHVFVPIDGRRHDGGRRRGDPGHRPAGRALDPRTATTAFVKDDREGKVFVDSTRAGGATVVAAYSPRARPGVPVSFPVAWDDLDEVDARPTSRSSTPSSGWATRDPWAEAMPEPAGAAGRPGRRGPRDPRRPGRGHARGQAAGPGQAHARHLTSSPARNTEAPRLARCRRAGTTRSASRRSSSSSTPRRRHSCPGARRSSTPATVSSRPSSTRPSSRTPPTCAPTSSSWAPSCGPGGSGWPRWPVNAACGSSRPARRRSPTSRRSRSPTRPGSTGCSTTTNSWLASS